MESLEPLFEKCLSLAGPGRHVELVYSEAEERLSRFANNGIQQNLATENASLRLLLGEDGRLGAASSNRLGDEGLKHMVETARAAARNSAPVDMMPELRSSCDTPDHRNLDAATADHSPEHKAAALAQVFERARGAKLQASGILATARSRRALANSAGLRCQGQHSLARFSTTFETPRGSGWSSATCHRVADLDTQALAAQAEDIALRAQDPGNVEAGRWTVVLPPAAVIDFLQFLGWMALGARSVLDGTGAFSGKAGEQVFGENITLREDAAHPLIAGCPWDWEGVSRRSLALIEKGVFRQPVYDLQTAREAGAESTGNALPRPNGYGPMPAHLVLEPGEESLQELVAGTEKGLFVTQFHYTNIQNARELELTGMTRDGVFLIENGRITKPVRNLRYTVSLFDLFRKVDGISREQKLQAALGGGGCLAPGLRVRDFNFSSVSSF